MPVLVHCRRIRKHREAKIMKQTILTIQLIPKIVIINILTFIFSDYTYIRAYCNSKKQNYTILSFSLNNTS